MKETGARKARRGKKEKDANKPKRPPSAYFLYLNEIREQIKKDNPGIRITEITKKAGEMWRKVHDKTKWEEEAKKKKAEYERAMADYAARGDNEKERLPRQPKSLTVDFAVQVSYPDTFPKVHGKENPEGCPLCGDKARSSRPTAECAVQVSYPDTFPNEHAKEEQESYPICGESAQVKRGNIDVGLEDPPSKRLRGVVANDVHSSVPSNFTQPRKCPDDDNMLCLRQKNKYCFQEIGPNVRTECQGEHHICGPFIVCLEDMHPPLLPSEVYNHLTTADDNSFLIINNCNLVGYHDVYMNLMKNYVKEVINGREMVSNLRPVTEANWTILSKLFRASNSYEDI